MHKGEGIRMRGVRTGRLSIDLELEKRIIGICGLLKSRRWCTRTKIVTFSKGNERMGSRDLTAAEARRILDVTAPYSTEEIKYAYRRKIKECHPDAIQQSAKEENEYSDAIVVINAYKVLIQEEKKLMKRNQNERENFVVESIEDPFEV